MRIVIFSGGRGCTNIIKSMLNQTQADLSIIVNAYDNGKSTGRIRAFIPGILGPSDIRKNVSTVLEYFNQIKLVDLLEFRLSNNSENISLIEFIRNSCPIAFDSITFEQYQLIRDVIGSFENYENLVGKSFDTTDCAVGNIIMAGLFLQENEDFNRAVETYQQIFLPQNSRAKVFNVTSGENLYLVARSNSGTIFMDEADIVVNERAESIREIALVHDIKDGKKESTFSSFTRPNINNELKMIIRNMDVLIYGPGTQASSLLPSYLTLDVLTEIRNNFRAKKIFISNLVPDFDDPVSNVGSRLATFFQLVQKLDPGHPESSFITNVFSELQQNKIPELNPQNRFPGIIFQTDDWLIESNKHLGAAIVRQVSHACGGRLKFKPGFVSVVISEVGKIFPFNDYLNILNSFKSGLNLDFEIIIVSNFDETDLLPEFPKNMELLHGFHKHFRFAKTISDALNITRGDLIAYIESKDLYAVSDVCRGIRLINDSNSRLVIGSRNLRLFDLKKQIKEAYPSQPYRGVIAYWGSLALSISFLLRYRRFISDPLGGIKIFKKADLTRNQLEIIGIDININLLKSFMTGTSLIQQFDIEFIPQNLNELYRHGFLQGLKSLRRIWSANSERLSIDTTY